MCDVKYEMRNMRCNDTADPIQKFACSYYEFCHQRPCLAAHGLAPSVDRPLKAQVRINADDFHHMHPCTGLRSSTQMSLTSYGH